MTAVLLKQGSKLLANFNWRLIFIVGLPLVLLPIIFLDQPPNDGQEESTKFRCAYVIILMASYWIGELIPLAMTSFIPIVLFPLLQVQSTEQVTMNYMKETNAMFLGGLIISFAVEYSNLHRRIALRVLTLIGSSPTKIVLGVMLTTMFLSMWILNSATAAMMIPVVLAVLDELNKNNELDQNFSTNKMDSGLEFSENFNKEKQNMSQFQKRQKQMMLLAVCYASDIGGSGVVTGTTPNLISFQLIKESDVSQGGKYTDLTFATWMAYAVPPMLINVLTAWLYLTISFIGLPSWLIFGKTAKNNLNLQKQQNKEKEERVQKLLMSEYKKLGPMNFHQLAVTALYFIVVILWLFRDPRFVQGWGQLFSNVKIGDSTPAMFIALILFAVPRDPSFFLCRAPQVTGSLLEWKYVQSKLPWDIVILMGSGFALSDAADKSGLAKWIGVQLDILSDLSEVGILIIVIILISSLTEVLSNAACANITIPILISLSKRLNFHPLYLTLPAAISCSFAFMLPVGAPTNGIVYAASRGDLTILDMVKAGAFIKVFCTILQFLIHIFYGNLLFNFNDYSYPNITKNSI